LKQVFYVMDVFPVTNRVKSMKFLANVVL